MNVLAQQVLEVGDYAKDVPVRLSQQNDKGDGFNYLRLADRYFSKKCHVLVSFQVGGVNQNFLAFVQRECTGDADKSVSECLFELFGVEHDILAERLRREHRYAGTSNQQKPMLISIVECMKSPEDVVSSLVWLEAFDFLNGIVPHSIYFSVKDGLVDFGTDVPFKDWERRVFGRSLAIGEHQGVGQVIERGAEVLQGIPNHAGDRAGNGVGLVDDVNPLAGLRIELSDDFIRLVTHEMLQRDTTVLDVMVGPLDLDT